MVIGEVGNDTRSAGTGNDTFRFAPGDGADTITNFNPALDAVQIAGTATPPAIHAFPSDILFDEGGQATMWIMNGATIEAVNNNVGGGYAGYHVAGVGDDPGRVPLFNHNSLSGCSATC